MSLPSASSAASRYLPPHIAGGTDGLSTAQRELVDRAAEVGPQSAGAACRTP